MKQKLKIPLPVFAVKKKVKTIERITTAVIAAKIVFGA